MKRIKLGIVGVDSGQLLICDPCYLQSEGLETSERLINSAPIQKVIRTINKLLILSVQKLELNLIVAMVMVRIQFMDMLINMEQ